MAKNFSAIYNSQNDAISLNQRIFIKEEVTRGVPAIATGADFINALSGASVNFSQPVESSPVRSGRHHTNIIKSKTSTEWTIPSFFMIDTALGGAANTEIDPAFRVLMKSLLGREQDLAGVLTYDTATDPDTTFTIFNNGDQWASQSPGSFVESGSMSFPGDGDAQIEFSGMAKVTYYAGIGKTSVANDGGNTVTLDAGDGARFEAGAYVMLVEADGSTRSADTPDGAPRLITDVTGDVVTLDGAALADADGSGADLFLSYYEPETPVAINDPQTGLQGSVSIVGLNVDCVRSFSINATNSHELQDFCYGTDALAGSLFVPGGRFTAAVEMELNLNHDLLEFIIAQKQFAGENITLILGDSAGRHMEVNIPKAIFDLPSIEVPDTGTLPISFSGNAYQSATDAFDELTIEFK